MTILNQKRLRDYPRLMLITTWCILAINLVFHQGWMGALGQLIGGDFLSFYSAGIIYGNTPSLVYDSQTQIDVQKALISPTPFSGYIPFINPPYVAPLYFLWTFIPLQWSLLLWTVLAIISVFLSSYLLIKLIPPENKSPLLSFSQLTVLTLSSFPFVEGLQAGQNHWITLLLVTAIIFSMHKERKYLPGVLAGLLIYKPQFLIGFIILWIVWKNYKALIALSAVTAVWVGGFILINGRGLLQEYVQLSETFMSLPYMPGFPKYILVTLYGLLASLFPQTSQSILTSVTLIILILGAAALAWLAYIVRKGTLRARIPAIAGAVIFPLLVAPHTLLHDFVILVPVYLLLSIYLPESRKLIFISVGVYLGVFFLTLLGALTHFAWVSLLTISVVVIFIYWIVTTRHAITLGDHYDLVE